MSIQAVKGVEIGAGVTAAGSYGSEVQDEISYDKAAHRFRRSSNSCRRPRRRHDQRRRRHRPRLPETDLHAPPRPWHCRPGYQGTVQAAYERSDWCVVPAAGVAGEAMVALVLADAFLQKFGGDSLAETRRNFDNYARQIDEF